MDTELHVVQADGHKKPRFRRCRLSHGWPACIGCLSLLGAAPGASSLAQETGEPACPAAIRGGWETDLPADTLFSVLLTVRRTAGGEYSAGAITATGEHVLAVWHDGQSLRTQSDDLRLAFDGRPSADQGQIDGFVSFASNLYRVTLGADGPNSWSGRWSALPVVGDSFKLDLYVDEDDAGGTGAYFFFRDGRLPSLYGLGASCAGNAIELREKNLGLTFRGAYNDAHTELAVTAVTAGSSADIVFTRMSAERLAMSPGSGGMPAQSPTDAVYEGQAPEQAGDGWPVASPGASGVDAGPLVELVEAVSRGELPNTHSVLVARSGVLIFERYFYGFDRDVVHDMRSASKSLTSALVGLAVDRGMIDGADARVLPFFRDYRSYASWDPRKANIRIRDLLTMSSGLDANDADRDSFAAEGAYQSQTVQPDWTKRALDAPMIADPGSRLIYGSANPLILGGILDRVVGDRLEWFADDALFRPLGIVSYRIYQDPTGVPYMGGGMYLRPRDMLKIGQLYLDGGEWRGRRVLANSWVVESFGRYGRLEPEDRNGNEYGYLWWHETYDVGGRRIDSVEARGNGGQYIFVIPELGVTAVVTSGNYRGGLKMTRQPQTVLQRYALPAVVNQPFEPSITEDR